MEAEQRNGLEEALAKTETEADAACKAATGALRSLKKFRAAAQVGNLRDLQKALEVAEQAITDLKRQFATAKAGWDVVILDEAQTIKNREAEISLKCKRLLRRRAWALAGTPLENSVEDLASLLEFVNPLREGEAPRRLAIGPALRERQSQVQLRRKKADVLPQLPPKIVSRIALKLEGSQRESYVRAEREGITQLRNKGEEVRVENILELIVRLKQICNFCPVTRQSVKLNDVRARLQTLVAEEHRALIFSQFSDDRYGARAIASAVAPFRPLLYTGDLAAAQKETTIKAFKTNPAHKVLVLSLRAGGEGLNLQEASYVFHFDRWWNPAIGQQAESRSHRFGQVFPAHVYS